MGQSTAGNHWRTLPAVSALRAGRLKPGLQQEMSLSRNTRVGPVSSSDVMPRPPLLRPVATCFIIVVVVVKDFFIERVGKTEVLLPLGSPPRWPQWPRRFFLEKALVFSRSPLG